MIRTGAKLIDSWKCIDALLNKKTATVPWSSWKVVKGWPESNVFTDLGTPIIFIEAPQKVSNNIAQQGGKKQEEILEFRIGLWDDRKTGGVEEITILSGSMLDFFGNMNTVHTATFAVTLGSAFTDTTLLAQGLRIEEFTGPRNISTPNPKEFRREFILRVRR